MTIDNNILPLYYLSSLAGLVMVVGGIWLLYSQKIYIDSQSKEVTEVEIPMIGKFRTNVPALVLFTLGFIPLIYPVFQLAGMAKEVKIRGNVKANAHPILIYAVTSSDSVTQDGSFSIKVPLLGNASDYKILYLVGNTTDQVTVDMNTQQSGVIDLKDKVITLPETSKFQGNVEQRPSEFK
jgi:hypothetical protein